jgi:hypothetical protein
MADCGSSSFPNDLTENAKLFAATHDFRLQSNGQDLGFVTKRLFAWSSTFDMKDAQGNIVATGTEPIVKIMGQRITVKDCNGNLIGTVKENVLSSLLGGGIVNQFSILDKNGNEIATSDKFQLIVTKFTIRDHNNRVVAEINKQLLNLTDHWSVDIKNPGAVDPRLLLMIAPFKTDADGKKTSYTSTVSPLSPNSSLALINPSRTSESSQTNSSQKHDKVPSVVAISPDKPVSNVLEAQ